jgi:circadian clock protein KaiB
MTPTDHELTLKRFEQALAALEVEQFALTLFVSGASDASANAIANVREICDGHLGGRHHLDIVDLHQQPAMAKQHHVLATPTLVKDHPPPLRMLVGDMSDHVKILVALDVRAAGVLDAP